jgi:hypothetical protein
MMMAMVLVLFLLLRLSRHMRPRLRPRHRYYVKSIPRDDALAYLQTQMSPIEVNVEAEVRKKEYINDIVLKKHNDSFIRIDYHNNNIHQ